MKIITLHQPWASLVALELKRYETRHWATDYRGPLLIHAAKRVMGFSERQLYLSAIEDGRKLGLGLPPEKVPFAEQLPLGCIVAIADLTKCSQMMNLPGIVVGWFEADPPEGFTIIQDKSALEQAVGLWEPGRYALQLDSVRSLSEPIPFKSRQGKLLDAPADIVALVNEQLKEVA
ncbi:MAG: ASCH domain-containing protein [Oculatellaceae cyanobacterium bins.114]|nr:ASCH domain-containing protein [Oculatellaceae cyanobacterium bins.114]